MTRKATITFWRAKGLWTESKDFSKRHELPKRLPAL